MSKNKLLKVVLAFSLLVPVLAFAQTQETREYIVKPGDTLWSIAGKELQDSFLWPKVWKANPEIADPDRLYPGEKVIIPLYVLKKEAPEETVEPPAVSQETVKPQEKAGPPPVELQPLVSKDLYVASGYIADHIESAGKIVGSPSGRNLFGNDDDIYIETPSPVQVGDKFFVFRADQLVRHPVTHEKIGYVVKVLGIAEVTGLRFGDVKASLRVAYDDIRTGDLLGAYYEITPPLTTDSFRRPVMDGVVLASESSHIFNTPLDVVYIDKGQKDGVEVGDVFETVFVGKHHIPTGVIQVIKTGETTSTAIVRENRNSNNPLSPGDVFTHLE